MILFPKFDFDKFRKQHTSQSKESNLSGLDNFKEILGNSPYFPEQTLDGLDALDGVEDKFEKILSSLPENKRYTLEERAAIKEYDGDLSQEQAEKEALEEFLKNKQ